jgi:glycosyltransferase involved in cell wall biosynthesis
VQRVRKDVLFASTSYPRDAADWRGTFMRNIVAALADRDGIQVTLWSPPGEADPRVRRITTESDDAWLASLMAQGGISHLLRSKPIASAWSAWVLLRKMRAGYRRWRPESDGVYHLNWLQSALPLPHDGIPALITVLGNDMRLLGLPFMRIAVRRALTGRPVALCPNADWMAAPLATAFGDLATVRPVPFGIDGGWYAIARDRQFEARPIARWLVVARLTADKLGPLFEWSEAPFNDGCRELHLFGPMQEPVAVPDWVHYHGPATPAQLARDWFPQAAGLVTLSRHAEGRPQVMLEAMASGLPIVASSMPAHADLVSHGVTGLLCSGPGDYHDALRILEDAGENHRMGQAGYQKVLAQFGTWADCAERYARVYDELIGTARHG